jgi:hypothetical protein
MASIISAGTTSGTSLNLTGDTSGALQFQTNGTTAAVTIDTSQNVGIGASSGLDGKLTLNQATGAYLSVQYAGTSKGYFGTGNQLVTGGGTGDVAISTTGSGNMLFASAGTERMRIDSSGNLGIGTSSPTQKITIGGGATGIGMNFFDTASGLYSGFVGNYATWQGTGSSDDFTISSYGTRNLIFGSNGSERMRIDSSGNVGIGNTPSGTYKLEVTGAIGDSIGNVRSVPLNSQTSAYILAASDNGKMVSITTGGVTVNNSIMSAGMVVTIYNNSGSSQTITQGTGVTLQWAGQSSSTTGNRTLGLYGICTIIFLSASSAVISGSGLT